MSFLSSGSGDYTDGIPDEKINISLGIFCFSSSFPRISGFLYLAVDFSQVAPLISTLNEGRHCYMSDKPMVKKDSGVLNLNEFGPGGFRRVEGENWAPIRGAVVKDERIMKY
ncbi:hypothetical protein H6P81_019880 [Aristolochia fimbriata]|uniref:Uncharacterized protein n=1 Tax=Aristolochia fimbriata TaxID=158543 RepID=A0AAV7DSV0_ARIFI|nr:hypothetical protein H6P81_019880 [Aristolochia fimbriata]